MNRLPRKFREFLINHFFASFNVGGWLRPNERIYYRKDIRKVDIYAEGKS